MDPSQQVSRLQNVRMGRDTPVRQFAQEVERLARISYPELVGDKCTPEERKIQRGILNRILLEKFIAGLPQILSKSIVEKQVEEFDRAVDLASHMDEVNSRYFKRSTINAFYNEEDSDRRRPDDRDAKPRAFHPRNQSNPARQTAGRRPEGRGQVRNSAPDSSRPLGAGVGAGHQGDSRRCYQCGEEGHLKRNCPKCFLCGENHPIQRCKNVVCAYCKQTGHAATRCSKNLTGPHHPPPTI